ncbi:MAG: hypothetical protein ACI9AD_001295, partial [Nitriliruptoraceae bacterium]
YGLRVPIEREAGNSLIAVLVPAGWTVVSCDAANGWSCEWDADTDADTTVSLTRLDDAAGTTDRFSMELTAPTEIGIYRFPVVQEYDDGTEAAWLQQPGSDHPAPRIQVGNSETTVERDETLPQHTANAGNPAATPSATPIPAQEVSAATTPPPASDSDADRDDSSGGPLLMVLAGGFILAVGAATLLRRGRS